MGYRTPNIDRIAKEGLMFTDYYAEQSCTAGRSSFITGQSVIRTGLSKVGIPGATVGLQPEDITMAEALKPLGYATGQFGKNHLGDRNEYLPTVHGFDEFFGNLSITSMLKRSPKTQTIRRIRHSGPNSVRAAFCDPKPQTLTIRRLILALARWGSKPSRIPGP
jgi:arylsulfatase A-like enzyme